MSYFAELVLIPTPFFPLLWGKRMTLYCKIYFAIILIFSALNMFVLQKLMVLGDGWEIKARENLRTGSLLLKKMGISISGKLLLLMKFNNAIGKLYNYISNIACIPDIEEWEQKR